MPNSASVTAHLGAPAHPSLEVIHRLPVNKINQIARFGLDELFLSTFTKTQHSHLLGRRIIGNFTPPVDARAVKHTIYSEKVGGPRCHPGIGPNPSCALAHSARHQPGLPMGMTRVRGKADHPTRTIGHMPERGGPTVAKPYNHAIAGGRRPGLHHMGYRCGVTIIRAAHAAGVQQHGPRRQINPPGQMAVSTWR